MKNKYDLIIAGGGTAGCACAYTAGKLGLNVLLIEKNSFLGGTMSSALVTPAMSVKTDKKINNDFYEKLMKNLHDINGQITYADGNIGWFNPELIKIVLDDMMDEANVDILFDTCINTIITEGNLIKGITLDINTSKNLRNIDTICSDNINNYNEILSEYIETKYLVDGTGDAKIFEKLNLEFLNNLEEKIEKKYQPASLRFIMSGIDIDEFAKWIIEKDDNRNVTSVYKIDGNTYLSTAYTWDKDKNWALADIFEAGIEEGLINNEDSNYFQIFSVPQMHSSLAFNCPRILENPDIYNKSAYSDILKRGRKSILRLSEFMKKKFKGFKNAYVSSIANSLGIRVSNRIKGKYIYTIDDLQNGKVFKNPVLISKYPIDIHSDKKGDSVLQKQEIEYMLPVESLISDDYDNLFAIGRCVSTDFTAQSALRIIPSCFSMGEGLAKYLAK